MVVIPHSPDDATVQPSAIVLFSNRKVVAQLHGPIPVQVATVVKLNSRVKMLYDSDV